MKAQVNPLPSVSDNVLGTRILIVTSLDQLVHSVRKILTDYQNYSINNKMALKTYRKTLNLVTKVS